MLIKLLILAVILYSFAENSFAQEKKTWEDILYAKNVNYEEFACQSDDREAVTQFFKTRPIKCILRVCHNNCAIFESFSKKSLPPLSEKVKGEGFIAVHVLVNENGRPIFSRAVNGNPLIRSFIENRMCDSSFKADKDKRQNILYVCPNEKCENAQSVE